MNGSPPNWIWLWISFEHIRRYIGYGTTGDGAWKTYQMNLWTKQKFGRRRTGQRRCMRLRKCWMSMRGTVSVGTVSSVVLVIILPLEVHAWGYRRYVLASMPTKRPETVELEYTTKKIESNFSNFSAWHQRTKVLSSLWSQGKLDMDSSKDEGSYTLCLIYT